MKIVLIEKTDFTKEQKARLEALGDVVFYDDVPNTEQAIRRTKDVDIVVVDWFDPTPILDNLKGAKLMAVMATGYDWINLKKARTLGISVANIPSYATEAVAEHAFGLMLNVVRKDNLAERSVHSGKWTNEPFRGIELKGKTLGVVGLGCIGSRTAEIGRGFGMNVIANDIKPKSMPGVEMMELDTLLRKSDIVTLHCDLNQTSRGLIETRELALMKPTAFLINTSRAGVVDNEALIKALEAGKIAGVGIDVIPKEMEKDNPFAKFDNVVITPHISFNTKESQIRRIDILIDNIEAFIKGKPQNIVN